MVSENNLRVSFTATGGGFLILLLKNFFLTLITLGVYNFWARVNLQRYFYEHTFAASGRLGWHATGKERCVAFVKAVLLITTIVALNYFLVKLSPYLAIIFPIIVAVLFPALIIARVRYHLARTSFNQVRCRFTGRAGDLALIILKGALLVLITFGVYSPWLAIKVRQFLYRHSYLGNNGFDYDGNGGDLFLLYLKGVLLTLVTFGIYSNWMAAEIANYHTNHTVFQSRHLKGDVDGGNIFVTNLVGRLLSFITLGIYVPWYIIKLKKVMLEGIVLTADIDFASIESVSDTGANALADGLADAASLLDNIADFLV